MKKRVFSVLIILLIFAMSFAVAEENNSDIAVDNSDNEQSKINTAYSCLENKVEDKCSSLSSEEKIFSLLEIKKCKDEVEEDLNDRKNIKLVAQAILALDEVGSSDDDAEDWLLSQNATPSDIDWLLQVESSEATDCSATYDGSLHPFSISEDKKINSNAGNCLTLSDEYWLRVALTCYEKEFLISCDKGFQTNFLYKKKTSSTIYVSEKTNSASAEGTITEKVSSVCFASGGVCDYEGSLWAALVLNSKGYDISYYLPYLVTMADENTEYLPESFLYLLTNYQDFRNDLLLKQKANYWDESGDKFYDTALALYPFQYSEPSEKTNAKSWLLEIQDKTGCWKGNIRNTAFILYSVWPKISTPDEEDCEDSGYYCISSKSCTDAGGNELDFDCAGVFVCCSKEKTLETCAEQNGKICSSNEECDGLEIDASVLSSGETCCIGSCKIPLVDEKTECEKNNGVCRSFECNNNEEESSYTCDAGDTCCIQKTEKNYLWIWILVILIILVVAGIVFKDKLRRFWFKVKSKFGKSKPGPRAGFKPPRGFPPSGVPPRRMIQRRILPPSHRRPARPSPRAKPSGELNDVLEKLKDMGK